MTEKDLSEKKQGLLERISQSKMAKAVKTVALTALLSGKTMGAKAVETEVEDAKQDKIELSVTSSTPQKIQKFEDIPELPVELASFVDHTYIVDQKMWAERDSIVVKCVDSRYVQNLSLTDVACARECKALPKSQQSEDGYISFNRDPGVIGSDGKATYNGIISTDFNATRQSIVLMCCSNDEKIAALGRQMVNGDCKDLVERVKKQVYREDGTLAEPAELQKVFAGRDFALLRGKIKNQGNRAAFNQMYQKVCRSDVESSIKFQEQFALTFYGIGRKGNLSTLNQKIKEANGGKADLTKVKPAVIGSALSEMIAKGHGTLTSNPMMLKLSVLNNTSSATNITNSKVLGPAARMQADKQSQYDYLTMRMVDELFLLTNNTEFYGKVQEKVQANEQNIEEFKKEEQKRSIYNYRDALKLSDPEIKPEQIKIDTLQVQEFLRRHSKGR